MPGPLVCQSHLHPTSTGTAEPNSSGDSNVVTEQGTDAARPSEETWVVDTITLAEYEAQLKTEAESASNSPDDSRLEAAADAYFDRFSPGEIDASIVMDKTMAPDAAGDSGIQQNTTAVPRSESPLVADMEAPPSHDADPTPNANPVNDRLNDSTTGGVSDAELTTLGAQEINTRINATVAAFDEKVSDSAGTTSLDESEANVIETANSDWTSAFKNEVSVSFLVAVSLGLSLIIMLLMWSIANLLSWRSRRRGNQTFPVNAYAQRNHQWRTIQDDGGDAFEQEEKPQHESETSDQGIRKPATFKKVTYPKRESQIGEKVAASNELLESQLIDAQESLALVKANNQRRDWELQAKVRGLNERLSAKTEDVKKLQSDLANAKKTIALHQSNEQHLLAKADSVKAQMNQKTDSASKLESDLRISRNAIANAQAEGDKRNAELMKEVDRLQGELSKKTADFIKLETDFQNSEQSLAVAQAKAAQREKELLVDLELLGDELSVQTENSTKLEAGLARAEKLLDSRNDVEKELEREHQVKVESFKKRLNTQSDVVANLKSKLLKSEKALAAAQASDEGRAKELQVEVEKLEERLRNEASKSAKHDADLLNVKQSLAERVAHEHHRNAELQMKSDRLEHKLRSKLAAFSQRKTDLLTAQEALAEAQAQLSKRETQWRADIDRLEEELSSEIGASSRLEAEMSVLREALEDQQANESQRVTELNADLTRVEQQAEQMRLELSAEKKAVAESEEKLAVSKSKVSKLKKKLSNAVVNRSNYMKLAKKVVRYKKLYRANEIKVKDLVEKNMQLSDLASEYLEAADGMIEKLSGQAKLVADLKHRMLQPEIKKSESSVLSGDALQDQKSNDLASSHSRKDVLALKEDFEPDSDGSAFVTPDGQTEDFDGPSGRVNRPR